MFVLEIVFKDVTLANEPIIIPGVFMFTRQDKISFETMMEMLLEAEPALRKSAAVFSDGCRTFGKVIDQKFPLAFHGVDRNHVENNLDQFMKDQMELEHAGFKKLKRKVKSFLRGPLGTTNHGFYDHDNRSVAAQHLERELQTWPAKLAAYVRTNKEEILLGVHTLAVRKAARLTRANGRTDFAWSQASESAHMVVNRWLEWRASFV
jgi:hypothetical protein